MMIGCLCLPKHRVIGWQNQRHRMRPCLDDLHMAVSYQSEIPMSDPCRNKSKALDCDVSKPGQISSRESKCLVYLREWRQRPSHRFPKRRSAGFLVLHFCEGQNLNVAHSPSHNSTNGGAEELYRNPPIPGKRQKGAVVIT